MQEPISDYTIQQAAEGDTLAFRQIVLVYQSQAFHWALRLSGNRADAQDLTQEAFIRIWKNLPQFDRKVKLSTWLYRIVFNLFLDYKKSAYQKRKKLLDDYVEYPLEQRSADYDLDRQELRQQILHAAAELSPKQQAAFMLIDVEGLPSEEVCEVLSVTADRLKSNLYYARQKIHKSLKVYLQDPVVPLKS